MQGTADMYGMEVEDIAKSHDSWKAQALVLKAQLVLRDKEIDKLVPPPLPRDLCPLLLGLMAVAGMLPVTVMEAQRSPLCLVAGAESTPIRQRSHLLTQVYILEASCSSPSLAPIWSPTSQAGSNTPRLSRSGTTCETATPQLLPLRPAMQQSCPAGMLPQRSSSCRTTSST